MRRQAAARESRAAPPTSQRVSRRVQDPIVVPPKRSPSLARVDLAFIAELEAFSLIEGEGQGESRSYPEESTRVVELAAQLRGYGIEPRHLRTFKHAAERESGVIEQVVMPMLQRRNPEAQKRAKAVLEELVETAAQFHNTFVHASLREIDTR